MSTPVLETPSLLLRPLRMSDAPRIQELFPRWGVVQYLAAAIPWPYPEGGAETFLKDTLAKVEAGKEHNWAITLKANRDDLLLGIVGLYPQSETDHRGFWIAEEYQRKGLMTEAVIAVNDF